MTDLSTVADAARRRFFYFFLKKVFAHLHNGQDMPNDDYLEALAFALQAAHEEDGGRLLVTIPPRHLKSIAAAVALPAWVLGNDPAKKVMVATYGDELSREHASNCASVMKSRWYQSLFPATHICSTNQSELRTTSGGGRRAVSHGGPTTGFGADLIIVDDLLKAQDAPSEARRANVHDYFRSALMSRFNDPSKGSLISIQQRLHEDDLPANLLEAGGFQHLNLPAIAEEPTVHQLYFDKQWRREADELLNPKRMGERTLERLRGELGARAFSAQYQQNPVPPEGAVVRIERMHLIDDDQMPADADWEFVIQSWDTAASLGPKSDFSVCTTWGYHRDAWYLLDLFRERVEYDQLEKKVFSLIERFNPDKVLIENSSNGRAFLQRQRMQRRRTIFHPVMPVESKEERLITQLDFLHSDRVRFCHEDPWWPTLKRELSAFPEGRYDDQVDSISQFLKWVTGRFGRRLLNTNALTGTTDLLKDEHGRYLPFDGVRRTPAGRP